MEAGQALEDDLLDAIAVAGERARDPGVERRALRGQAADDGEGLLPQLALQGDEVAFGLDGGKARAARVVLGPGEVQLVAEAGA